MNWFLQDAALLPTRSAGLQPHRCRLKPQPTSSCHSSVFSVSTSTIDGGSIPTLRVAAMYLGAGLVDGRFRGASTFPLNSAMGFLPARRSFVHAAPWAPLFTAAAARRRWLLVACAAGLHGDQPTINWPLAAVGGIGLLLRAMDHGGDLKPRAGLSSEV